MSKLILLNGPIGCGKTAAVQTLVDRFSNTASAECKEHLHLLTQIFFNVEPSVYWTIYEDRSQKELPQAEFQIQLEEYNKLAKLLGKPHRVSPDKVPISIREAMIYVSELVCKPAFGEDYFGRVRASKLNLSGDDTLYIDDSAGFEDEVPPAIQALGQENILLIRVRGRGTFDGDSRNYLPDGLCDHTVDVYNTASLQEFVNRVCSYVQGFINRPPRLNPCNAHAVEDFKHHIQ
ncbi:hypothetical protein [Zhongshania sp.]|uniref:hypothetical protein n=1 Tax=Zhongshania sp. TaxID=1971902 RepID=UPI003561C375